MSRRRIKKIIQDPQSYGEKPKQFPTVSIRPNATNKIHNVKQNIQRRKFNRTQRVPLKDTVKTPINFLRNEFANVNKDVCFIVGGGPSLNGFDFTNLNGYDTIAINKAVEYISNPTYFITTDYSYFVKASLPIDQIKLKTQRSYFVANMSHPYMELKNNQIVDTRRNFVYEDLYQYDGVIEAYEKTGFSTTINEFCHGDNSGHCGIQLALLLGYKKIYLLGFDLNDTGQSHFHQSYRDIDQKSFKNKAKGYSKTLLDSLKNYSGSQEIINLSGQSVLTNSPHIKTESFIDVISKYSHSQKIVKPNDNSTLDNLMVVGYYTINTPYQLEAQNLIRSLNKLGINQDVIGVETLGNWQANTRFKAGFMLDMLNKWPNYRLLYVDVDAVVHRMPDLFKNYECDIAVRWQDFRWRKNECLSGTIYMENNERTRRICQLWRDINIKEGNESNRMEQWNLDTVINQMKAEDPNFTYKNLPPEYTMIFDSMRGMYPNIVPVIEHFQASRRFKKDVNEK
tara:strand:+ start:783 stop:2312 length:1530 start_codon:yes stop_codon:yes gene_type:complete